MTSIVPHQPDPSTDRLPDPRPDQCFSPWSENMALEPTGNPYGLEANRIMAALRCNRPDCECHRPNDLVHCPVHAGTLPKLLINETDDGFFFECFMRCRHPEIADALNTMGILTHRGAPAAEPPEYLHVRRVAADIPRPLVWLWPDYIPLGGLTLLHGAPGTGKSWIALDLAARVSAANPPPDGFEPMPRGPVMLVTPFASSHTTLSPRLTELRADFDDVLRLHSVDRPNGTSTPLQLPKDADHLIELIEQMEVRLLIIDPLESVAAAQGLRNALNALAWVAASTGAAVLATCHVQGLALAHAIKRAAAQHSPAASVLVTGLIDPRIAPRTPRVPHSSAPSSVSKTPTARSHLPSPSPSKTPPQPPGESQPTPKTSSAPVEAPSAPSRPLP
ncbi:MAG: AAA family ATPase [Chloroflexi bacterium]|nr:AAA family ATPase [Chloroflexota bacterium]